MNKKGFTLVELLVTIGIVSILLLIVVPLSLSTSKSIKNKLYTSKTETLVSAAELYVQNNQLLYGIGTCNGLSLATNEACIKVSELIEKNYAEIDINLNDNNCDSINGCITNPIDSSSMNDDWILVKKTGINTVGIWKGEPTGTAVMPLMTISNELDCVGTKNVSIDFGAIYSGFIYKYYIDDIEHNVTKPLEEFSVSSNSKITAKIFKDGTLAYETEKNVTNIGNNLRTVNLLPNDASIINTSKVTCCDAGSGCDVTLPSFDKKTGFEKYGWDLSKDTFEPSKSEGDTISINSDVNYYAISGKKLTANFYGNTAYSISSSIQKCNTSSGSCNIDTPSITPKTNYITRGWNTNSNALTAQVAQNTNISINSDVNYYAITVTKKVTKLSYNGSYHKWKVPKTGQYQIELWGASINTEKPGGGYTLGKIDLTAGEVLYFYVGQQAQWCEPYWNCKGLSYNGGGAGGYFNDVNNGANYRGDGGAGATDVRCFINTITGKCEENSNNLSWNNSIGLNSRIMVAGGSGSANIGTYGVGGGLQGETGYKGNNGNPNNGTGGSQTRGGSGYSSGSFGLGGSGKTLDPSIANCNDGGGGGGGYYGGGGGLSGLAGCNPIGYGGGGGGSSYISGHAGCIAIQEGSTTSTRAIKSGCDSLSTSTFCSTHYSGKLFTDTKMIDGAGYRWTTSNIGREAMPNPNGGNYASGVGHSGNGQIRITYYDNKE